MYTLVEKTAFVTGGSRGIGAAIVRALAKQGANVAFTYYSNAVAAQKVIDEIQAFGKKYKAYPCDVSNSESVAATITLFNNDFTGIDILINNAGIIQDQLLGAMSFENWNQVIQTNLTSAFLHTQAFAKIMMNNRSGNIINISSIVGAVGNVGQSNYAASKAGLIGFTKSLAKELGTRNIRCNAIAPGFIQTDMTAGLELNKNTIPLRRLGTAEDVALVALFLASDASGYITGQVINVCGGLCI